MAKEYLKKLHEQIEALEDGLDGKDLQVKVLENDMVEVLKPSILGSKITLTVLEMLSDVTKFINDRGTSEKSEKSRKRLISLLNDVSELDMVTGLLNKLQFINRDLHKNYQLLRVENASLRKELQKMIDSEKF